MTHESKRVADQYLENAVENAPPAKLVRMLVEGAVRFIDRSIAASPKTDRKSFVHWAQRSDAILVELRLSLVAVEGSDVAANLEQLYLFCENCIAQALMKDSHAPLHEARQVLAILLDAWQRIETTAEAESPA